MRNSIILFCFIIAVIAVSASCKEEEEADAKKVITGIVLEMSGLTLQDGGSRTLNVSIEPEDAVYERIRWYSGNPRIAYVDENGHITAISEGVTEITATTSNMAVSSTCIVAVMGPYMINSDDSNEPFMQMVKIEGGSFQIGSLKSEQDRQEDENMRRNPNVTLSDYWIGKYQVTQKQYQTVMGTNPSIFKGKALPEEVTTGDNLPVETVSWYNAIAFCNTLSILEGLTPVYTMPHTGSSDPEDWGVFPVSGNNALWDAVEFNPQADGYRLPTEAEWEHACRAGTTTMYWTGDDELSFVGKANVADLSCLEIPQFAYWHGLKNWSVIDIYDGFSEIAPVGSFAPNPFGLYDMLGNVWEWCWDWYTESYDKAGGNINPKGASTGVSRVLRGGSWGGSGEYLRTAYRLYTYPYHKGDVIGFRVARNFR